MLKSQKNKAVIEVHTKKMIVEYKLTKFWDLE